MLRPNRIIPGMTAIVLMVGCAAAPRPEGRGGHIHSRNDVAHGDAATDTTGMSMSELHGEVARLRAERDHLLQTNAVIEEELRWLHEDLRIIERQFTEFEHHLTEDFGKAAAVAATAEARIRLHDEQSRALPDSVGQRVASYLLTAEHLIRDENFPAAIFFAERARHTIDSARRHAGLGTGPREMTVAVDVANLRNGPGSEFPIISQMKRGHAVLCLNTDRSWCHVRDDTGASGWIHASLLK